MLSDRNEGDALAGSPPEGTLGDAVAESASAASAPVLDAGLVSGETTDGGSDTELGAAADPEPTTSTEAADEPTLLDAMSEGEPDDVSTGEAAAVEAEAEAVVDETVAASEDTAAVETEADGAAQLEAAGAAGSEEAEPKSEVTEAEAKPVLVEDEAAAHASDDPHHWDGPSVPFVPHHALLEGMMALAFLSVFLILVATMPAPLEARANPYLSPEGVKPEWYLMAPFWLLHLVPPLPGMLGVGAAIGVLMMWPFIDRRPRRFTRRPFLILLTIVIVACILALSIYPYFAPE